MYKVQENHKMNAVKISDVEEAEYVFERSLFNRIKTLEHRKEELFEKIESEKNIRGGFSMTIVSSTAHELELVIAKLEELYDLKDGFRNCLEVKEGEI